MKFDNIELVVLLEALKFALKHEHFKKIESEATNQGRVSLLAWDTLATRLENVIMDELES